VGHYWLPPDHPKSPLTENSRWDLAESDVGGYLARSYDFIMDLLLRMDRADPFRLDPSGDAALRMAKQVRRRALREAGADRLREEAERHFGMPATALPYSRDLTKPLYVPVRSASS